MGSLDGFANFHGEKCKEMMFEYMSSLKNKDINTLSNNIDLNRNEDKKKVRKCGLCGEYGHNRRTCKKDVNIIKKDVNIIKKDVNIIKKDVIKKDIIKKDIIKKEKLNGDEQSNETAEIEKCFKCNNECSNPQLIKDNGKDYCFNCYKVFIEDTYICKDCHQDQCDCKTKQLSVIDNELISDINNDSITYEGVSYYYDDETKILANDDYEEVGEWLEKDNKIEWYNEEYKSNHILCKQ